MNELKNDEIYEILRKIDCYTAKELQAIYKKVSSFCEISHSYFTNPDAKTCKDYLIVMITHMLKSKGYEYDIKKDMVLLERAYNLHHKLNTKCYYGVECKISRSVLICECKHFGITGYTKYKKNDLVKYMLSEISEYAGLYTEIKEQQEQEEEEKREKEIIEQYKKEQEKKEEEKKEQEKKKVKKDIYLPVEVFKNILDFCGEPLPPDIITNREPKYDGFSGSPEEFRKWANRPIRKEDLEEQRGYKITQYTYTREQGKIKKREDYRWVCTMCKTKDFYTGQRYAVCGRCEEYYHQQKFYMRFGRHKDKRWGCLDDNYKKWVVENMRGNEKLVDFCKHTLKYFNR